jgi:TfoX/Sxy family transcriptional regulator of competence genes
MSPGVAVKKKWKKAPERWVEAFDAGLPEYPGAERRKMFGYPCVFLNGNMVAGLHEIGLVIRLPLRERGALEAIGGKPFEPMPGRVMREYVVAPESLAADHRELARWLRRAFEFVATLPSKQPKVKADKATASVKRSSPKTGSHG